MGTKLLYLEDFTRLECDAIVVRRIQENGLFALTKRSLSKCKEYLLLDQTVFYPQGGGQPYDTGVIESPAGKFIVEEVRLIDGIVRHIGYFEGDAATRHATWKPRFQVACRVDAERRMLHSRIHSAGHLVDFAVAELMLPWMPGKGYHFPQGPYVEYEGMLGDADKEKLKADIGRIATDTIRNGKDVSVRFMPKEEMLSVCRFVPENIPADKPGRMVVFGGDFGVPCGGTHVRNLSEIRGLTIRKIKQEGQNIRVGYDVAVQ